MKKNWKVIVGLILALIVVVFAAMNMEKTTVNFGFTQLQQPLIILILASTLIGAIIVALFSSTSLWSRNHQIKVLEKELAQAKEQNHNDLESEVQQLQQELERKNKEIEMLQQNNGVNHNE